VAVSAVSGVKRVWSGTALRDTARAVVVACSPVPLPLPLALPLAASCSRSPPSSPAHIIVVEYHHLTPCLASCLAIGIAIEIGIASSTPIPIPTTVPTPTC
jgi:hypothetical protein